MNVDLLQVFFKALPGPEIAEKAIHQAMPRFQTSPVHE